MTDLVDAYQRREVHTAEKIIRGMSRMLEYAYPQMVYLCQDNRSTIMDDSFIRSHIGDLLRSLRTQYLIDLIKPYTRLELSFLAKVCDSVWMDNSLLTMVKQLNVDANEVEELLIDLILEGKIDGKIDQVNMRLELDKQCALFWWLYSTSSNFSIGKASRGGDIQL
jgi:COP9 signalosome complex subunit 2